MVRVGLGKIQILHASGQCTADSSGHDNPCPPLLFGDWKMPEIATLFTALHILLCVFIRHFHGGNYELRAKNPVHLNYVIVAILSGTLNIW